jgi:hypothetical protein
MQVADVLMPEEQIAMAISNQPDYRRIRNLPQWTQRPEKPFGLIYLRVLRDLAVNGLANCQLLFADFPCA